MHNIYLVVHNIVCPSDLGCINAPRVKNNNSYFNFWNAKDNENFSIEELDFQFIQDRYKDIYQMSWKMKSDS